MIANMKRAIYTISLFGMALLLVASCEGFLDRAPYDEVSSETVYRSASLAEAAVIGVYSNVRYDYVTSDANFLWDAFSSVLDPNTLTNYSAYPLLMGTIQPNSSIFLNRWKRLYETVNRANDVISNISSVPDMTDAVKACRVAECKFHRAFAYYMMNCVWQGVPIYLENLAPSQYTKARSTADEVWQLIVDECTDCIDTESMPMKYEKSSSDKGRITKAAAYFLRAKAYMWLKKWDLAATDLREIYSGGYSLYTGSYESLFTEENEKCDEMVYSINMTEESGSGNIYPFIYGNVNTAGGGWNRFFMNTNFCNTYEWADGRAFSFDDVIPGFSSLSVKERSVYFFRDNMTDAEKSSMTDYGAKMSEYLSIGNEARIKAAYVGRDPRLDATIITPYESYHGGYPEDGMYVCRYPYRATDNLNLKTQFNQYNLYCIQKFVTEGRTYLNSSFCPVDVPIFRFADVLLCLAECINEQPGGSMEEAISYVNQVRARAGVALLNSGETNLEVATQAKLRERIQMEKHWELACENQLYFEELRWGTWKNLKFAEYNGLTQMWGDPVYKYKWDDAYQTWAIPSSEIEKNSNLKQNDGWK